MVTRLVRRLWPPRFRPDEAFRARMHEARQFGVEQQRASRRAVRDLRASRDFAEVLDVPPPWRSAKREGGS